MKANPDQLIIVFDLHEVLLKKRLGTIFKIGYSAFGLDFYQTVLRPSFILKVLKLFPTNKVPEQYVHILSEEYPVIKSYIDIVFQLSNAQQRIPETVKLAQKLHQSGFSLYLFSNIGEETFRYLKPEFSDLFNLFEGILTTEKGDNWIQKPSHAAFKKFLQQFDLQAHQCLFIDNNRKNIKSAQECGFNTIHYRSPQQLQQALDSYGLLDPNKEQ